MDGGNMVHSGFIPFSKALSRVFKKSPPAAKPEGKDQTPPVGLLIKEVTWLNVI
jgi:hypothetical protein